MSWNILGDEPARHLPAWHFKMADTVFIQRIHFYLLVIASVLATSTAGTVISCQITPSDDSEYKHLTCIFAVNVGRLGKSFALYQDFGSTSRKRKVSCNFFNGKPLCEVTDGFQAPETVTERAVFLVPKTSNASFICDTIPPAEGVENRGCIVDDGTPQATQTPIGCNENTGWPGWHTGAVVAGVLLMETGLIIAAVLVRCKCRQRRASKTKEKDKADIEEFPNLNQQGQDAELETSAAITSAGASGKVGGLLDWCECRLCRPMPEEYERLCCRMTPCLSTTQKFKDKVLDRAKAWEPKEHGLLHNDVKETKRKQAYTWFTEWKHGPLSRGAKSPVYSCCVWAVRDMFPSKDGEYTGFVKGQWICFKTDDFIARWGKHKT